MKYFANYIPHSYLAKWLPGLMPSQRKSSLKWLPHVSVPRVKRKRIQETRRKKCKRPTTSYWQSQDPR